MLQALLPLLLLFIAGDGSSLQPPPAVETRVEMESGSWTLVGTLRVPSGTERAPAVLMLNGAARDRRAYGPLAAELAARGLVSLRLDLRGEGESINVARFEPGQTDPRMDGAEHDVVRALQWLANHPRVDAARIGVLGASYSGELMAAAARLGSPAAAYVALSPGSFSDTSARAIDASGIRWWFIASADERFAQGVVQRIPSLSTSARVTIVPGNAHASDLLSPHFLLNADIADWFDVRLRRRTAPSLWGTLEPGPHAVGWRTLQTSTGSALRIDVWYPAGASEGAPVRYADYFSTADDLRGISPADLQSPASMPKALAVAIGGAKADSIPRPALERILQSAMAARRDAPIAPGRHPLVLWTPRYSTTAMQAVLCEFLASHGFVVAAPRPLDGKVLLPFEAATPEAKRAELGARLEDMMAARGALIALPSVDPARIGVLAWSYSGEMATLFQQGEPSVSLVAGLSTTLLNDWVYGAPTGAEFLDAATLSATYAVLTQAREGRTRPGLLDRLAASYYVEFTGGAHGSFNALEGYIPALSGITAVQPWSVAGAASETTYRGTAIILLRLLRHHVRASNREPLRPTMLAAGLPSEAVVWSSAVK
jgi:dienelactone hydrolase